MTYCYRFLLAGLASLALIVFCFWPAASPDAPQAHLAMPSPPEAAPASAPTATDSHSHHHAHGPSGARAGNPATQPPTPLPPRLPRNAFAAADPEREPAFAKFQSWTRAYLNAPSPKEREALLNKGLEHARKRRAALFSLIQTDPRRALELSVPLDQRRELPAAVDALLEKRVSGQGDYEVLCVFPSPGQGRETVPFQQFAHFRNPRESYRAFVYGARQKHDTVRRIPMHGVAVDDVIALSENPVRLLEPNERASLDLDPATAGACALSGHPLAASTNPVPVEVGGKIQILCSYDHAAAFNEQLLSASGRPGGADVDYPVGNRDYSEGRKRIIIFRVAFANIPNPHMTQEEGLDLLNRADEWMTRVSYGRLTVAPAGQGSDVVQVTLPADSSTYDDNAGAMRNDVRSTARANGIDLDLYDFDITATGSQPSFDWAGLGFVGAPGSWIRSGGGFGTGVTVHELGHNFGLPHGNFWNTGGESTTGPGDNQEYGDNYDVMGSGGSGSGDYCARFKNYIGWIPDEDYPLITSSRRLRLASHDNPDAAGLRGFQITRQGDVRYSAEFRQRFTGNPWIMNGLGLRWGSGRSSQLLDTTPGVGGRNGREDSAILAGRTYSDYEADTPVHITPLGFGSTYPQSMEVQIHIGAFPANQPPSLRLTPESLNVPANTPLSLSALATDPDGDELAFHWEFGNEDFGPNQDTVSYAWPSAGEYVVRCTASDMKGGATSKSLRIRVGAPSTFTINGRVLANGQPLAGVLVEADSSRYAYTDSDGTYTITDLGGGSYNVSANLYPYTLIHPWFENPVNVGPDAQAIDFIAVDAPVDDTILLPEDAAWSYLDDGSDQGTAWRTPSFDDSSWAAGPAQLGYGDGDEATVVSFGPDTGAKYITTYFRRDFSVANPGSLTNLTLGLLRDDGGIVYLNGVEIRRDNMPGDPVTHLTEANGAIPNGDEDLFFDSPVDLSLLNAGPNTMAVEIHQAGPTSSDISFAARLTATSATNFQGLSLFYIASPANDQTFNPGADVPISVNAFQSGGSFTRMEFFGDGVKLGQDETAPFSLTWPAPALGEHTLSVVATDGSGTMSTSAPVLIRIVSSPSRELVSLGATWKYLDDGSNQGSAWATPGFDDSTWAEGPAELGYGDGDEATVVSFGADPGAKHITTYFRRSFNVTDPSLITSLDLGVLRDDGVVVYLNGNEVFRDNMPDGAVNHLSQALASTEGTLLQTPVSPGLLVAGPNSLAVEIHQNRPTSSDISFNLFLRAESLIETTAAVAVTSPQNNAAFSAPAQINLAADAVPDTGFLITRVEFFEGGNFLGMAASQPYQVTWNAARPGTYAITARASQSDGTTLNSAPVTVRVTDPPISRQLVSPQSTWRYLDTGVYPGPEWTSAAFADSLWMSGRARLGYGGDGEITVVDFGNNVDAKRITTWFRHSFTAPAGVYDLLKLRLARDDGAVIYLNGSEVLRSNMKPGRIDPNSLAVDTISGPDETAFLETIIPPDQLLDGANLIAVEVHQQSLNSSDLGFDLALSGIQPTNLSEGVYLTQPADHLRTTAGTVIPLHAYASSPAGVARVEFFDGPASLGQDTTPPYTLDWTPLAEGSHSLTARAITDDSRTLASPDLTVEVDPAPSTIIPLQSTLIRTDFPWRYFDDGFQPADDWMAPAYDDSAWNSGSPRMGFGLDGELTSLNPTVNAAYFRRTFRVSSPAAFAAMTLRFQRDDGIAIYLNGTEIHRNNLPAGPLDYGASALSGVSGLDEQYFFSIDFPTSGSGLIRGLNTLAVEVHQSSDSSSDLGFNLELQGRGSTEPRIFLARPLAGALLPLSVPVQMEAFVLAAGGDVQRVEFFANGVKIGEKTSSPYDLNWTPENGGSYELTAKSTDLLGGILSSPPLEVLVGFESIPATFVATGSTWRYLDNGSDQGNNWRNPGFNDASWAAGPAQLGYGDGDEATVVSFGPNGSDKFTTTYFRHSFTLPDGALAQNLTLRLLRDDGAVIYLNGEEIVRDNMPAGTINHQTPADSSVGGGEEDSFFLHLIDPALLAPGENILAAEVHQISGTSSDISFDLELAGTQLVPTLGPPTLTIRRLPGNMVELAWPASHEGWSLYNAISVDPGTAWQPVFSSVVVTNGENVVTVPARALRFFRLQK